MVTNSHSFERHAWDLIYLKVEMSQLTTSRRQVGKSLPFKQNILAASNKQ